MAGVWKYLSRLWANLRGRWLHIRVDELPAKLKRRRVYFLEEDGLVWRVAFLCPCGCGEAIELNTVRKVRPNWQADVNPDESVTLHPSVNRIVGCRSHFFMRGGAICWCNERSA